jgi:UrcA family protein
MKRPLIALTAAAVLGTAAPAFAETFSIPYGDLNLANEAGQQALERRIDVVAREYCGLEKVATGTLVRSASARKCYTEMKESAKTQFAAVVDAQRLGG